MVTHFVFFLFTDFAFVQLPSRMTISGTPSPGSEFYRVFTEFYRVLPSFAGEVFF